VEENSYSSPPPSLLAISSMSGATPLSEALTGQRKRGVLWEAGNAKKVSFAPFQIIYPTVLCTPPRSTSLWIPMEIGSQPSIHICWVGDPDTQPEQTSWESHRATGFLCASPQLSYLSPHSSQQESTVSETKPCCGEDLWKCLVPRGC
jgi:hypothetical protein